jgi:hypothetical protein
LVRVDYGNPSTYEVALCIRSEKPDRALVKKIGNVFADQFGATHHMDIIFLQDAQERDVAKVSQPFYRATEQIVGPERG